MLVLASNSPRRKELLRQAGIKIDKIVDPNIDETPFESELPLRYVKRMALEKSLSVEKKIDDFVISADTIVVRGRRVFGKPINSVTATRYLKLLSGCRHRVITSVCLANRGTIKTRTVTTIVKMKRLSNAELVDYLNSGEWKEKAGGYAIQGRAAKFIVSISGSYSNVVGLPLFETINLLIGSGYILDQQIACND